VIDFNDDYSSCNARVITAKRLGAGVIRGKSLATGAPIEIRSVDVSGTSCSMRNGNAFTE
jgi:hypothetical protein